MLRMMIVWHFRRPAYANGKRRPLFRGWLHGLIAVAAFAGLCSTMRALVSRTMSSVGWRLVGLLMGKFASYFSSATYHLYPANDLRTEEMLLKADLVVIPLSIGAGSCVYARGLAECFVVFGSMIAVTFYNARLVAEQLSDTACRGPAARSVVLFVYALMAMAHIGWHHGYNNLWLGGSLCYLLGFAVSPPVHHHLSSAPWHGDNYGWHEDFHVLLAAADLIYHIMTMRFLRLAGET